VTLRTLAKENLPMPEPGAVHFINPPTLNTNPAFTNVVVVTGPVKTVYVGGQDSVDSSGTIVGKGDFERQTEQVLLNLQAALAAAGAELHHVIKWNLFVVQGQDLRKGFAIFQKVWANRPNPPAISGLFVSALAHPDFLLEMDAIAVVPR
jgi:enamine deaminase RidA (YjgF/YER057c/UK114 family)